MVAAIWLVFALPFYYFFSAATFVISPNVLSLVPAVGALSLGVGALLAERESQRGLRLFLVPFALSEMLVAIAGFMPGQVRQGSADTALVQFVDGSLFVFMAIQIAVPTYLAYRLKGASAIAFAIFSVTYAAVAAFVASMTLRDTWL